MHDSKNRWVALESRGFHGQTMQDLLDHGKELRLYGKRSGSHWRNRRGVSLIN